MLLVEYNFRSFKAPTTPATLLVEAKNAACGAFGLSPLEYTLVYKGKALDLTLPLRFTSLVNGAKLSLEKVELKAEARVKLRLASGDFVGTFSLGTRIWEVLEAAGADGVAFLADRQVPNDQTLLEIGVNGSAVFSVRPAAPIVRPVAPVAEPAQIAPEPRAMPAHCTSPDTGPDGPNLTKIPPEPLAVPPGPSPDERQPIVETRQAAGGRHLVPLSGEVPEPTVSQAQNYLAHLRSQAAPKPMVSKSTLQSLRHDKRMQQEISVRVRLPDMSIVGGVFQPRETGAHVYNFVRGLLASQGMEFTLESVPPGFELRPEHRLAEDTDFDARVLLQLKTESKGPFLNAKAMGIAAEAAVPGVAAGAADTAEAPAAPAAAKKPKWFKLGK